MRTGMMRLLHFVAIRTLGNRRREQVIVRPPLVLARLGMSPFWVRHYTTPRSRLARSGTQRLTERSRILRAMCPEIYLLFLEPVLLQPREGSEPRVAEVPLTPALLLIEVCPAVRAQPPAIALADHFHRQRQ